MSYFEIKNLYKKFGDTEVLKGVSVTLEKGEVLSIIGSSGSGKTTLLRTVNFLETANSGQMVLDGEVLFDGTVGQSEKELRKKRLNFGLVFQSFHLFPQYNVIKNITLAPMLLLKEKVAKFKEECMYSGEKWQELCQERKCLEEESKMLDSKKILLNQEVKVCEKEKQAAINRYKELSKSQGLKGKELSQKIKLYKEELELQDGKAKALREATTAHKEECKELAAKRKELCKSIKFYKKESKKQGLKGKELRDKVNTFKAEQKSLIETEALSLLDKIGLSDKVNSYPCELSGGQCQRVAIARALALSPKILCFDEPTSALDPELTGEVLRVIRSLKNEGRTMIIVTHEMNFAKSVSDKVVFLADGQVEEVGDPISVFEKPQSPKLQRFFRSFQEGERE